MTCEPAKIEFKTSTSITLLPQDLRSRSPTLCSNDQTKFVYDSSLMPDDFKNAKDEVVDLYWTYIGKELENAQKNLDETKIVYQKCLLLRPGSMGEEMCRRSTKIDELTTQFNNIKNSYDAVLSAIQPLSTDTGNPRSYYSYECRGDDVFRCKQCKKGFFNTDCEFCNDEYCSGHGNTCVILNNIPTCQKCDTGFTGTDCGTAVKNQCPGVVPCNEKGTCTDGICQCIPGYTGVDCGTIVAKACPSTTNGPCNVKGTCTGGKCQCNTGYTGDDCGTIVAKACPSTTNGPCNVKGTCVDGKCQCSPGFVGVDCGTIVANVCPSTTNGPCNGKGTCVDGKCQCNTEYTGDSCSIFQLTRYGNIPGMFLVLFVIVLCAIAGIVVYNFT